MHLLELLNTPYGGAFAAIVLSAMVRALPEPDAASGKFYRWFYTFTHLVLANFDKLAPKK